jgi:hypothetical protein
MNTTGLNLALVETSIFFPGFGCSITFGENIMWRQPATMHSLKLCAVASGIAAPAGVKRGAGAHSYSV